LRKGEGDPQGKVKHLRIYNRPLMHTEVIGNHRYFEEDPYVEVLDR